MARYRQISPIVEAEQVRVADRCWPSEVIPWEGLPPNDSFGFVGTGDGLVHVWDGDWILRGPADQPVRVCKRDVFSRTYELCREAA